jgi:mediator of replication checkpoint protein 1
MNGGLRRRAGGRDGFDMSDSEDEEDMRLRKKRAEFQKMNRALLADERIGNIAKDQKKQAFFHTLADFADEGDYEFLEMPAEIGSAEQSQSQEDGQKQDSGMDIAVPDSQTLDAGNMSGSDNPLKRKSPSDSQKENRPPPNLRRTAASDSRSRSLTFKTPSLNYLRIRASWFQTRNSLTLKAKTSRQHPTPLRGSPSSTVLRYLVHRAFRKSHLTVAT